MKVISTKKDAEIFCKAVFDKKTKENEELKKAIAKYTKDIEKNNK